MTKYVIKGHATDGDPTDTNWDESYAGSETAYYDTREAAEAGIVELRQCGPDFAEADWRVFEVEVDD